MIQNKEQRIINLLKRSKNPVSTSKIATLIKSNFWMTQQYLDRLERSNQINRVDRLNSTFWELAR